MSTTSGVITKQITGSGALVAGTLTEVSGGGGIGMDGESPISGLNTIDHTGASDRKDGPHSITELGDHVTGRLYIVRITGPGIDSRIAMKDEEDVDIVEAMLKKVRRLLKAGMEGKSGG